MNLILSNQNMAIFKSIKALFSGHKDTQMKDEFSPPPGPPPPALIPLNPATFSRISPDHQASFPEQGWAAVTVDNPADALYSKALALIEAGKIFFDQPQDVKEAFKTKLGSEEGWSRVEGEKELVTMRTLETTPPDLRDAAREYWAEASVLLEGLLEDIAKSLGLPGEALTVFFEPCRALAGEKTATMLRLFRYEGFEGEESKIVAEGEILRLIRLLYR